MKLKKVGFFAELPHGDETGPSLPDSVRDQGEKDERKLIAFLEKGILFIGCAGIGRDVIDESAGLTEPPHVLTDGVWAWPGDLAYYLKKYHVELPEDFLSHIRNRRYSLPRRRKLDLTLIEL